MKHSSAVLLVLLAAQILFSPEALAQQADTGAALGSVSQEEVHGVALEQNYPNPFSDATRIPLILGSDLFQDGRAVVVTVRIFNMLHQLVATPSAMDHPAFAGQPVVELRYDQPGRYTLYWDGRDSGGSPVASGVYFCQAMANGARAVRRMIVMR